MRDTTAEHFGFENSERMMFHIHEGMSWEAVRNLNKMRDTLILNHNIASTSEIPNEVRFWVDELRDQFNETLAVIKEEEST